MLKSVPTSRPLSFLHSKVKPITDVRYIFETSYDEARKFLTVSSYKLLIICQAVILDEN